MKDKYWGDWDEKLYKDTEQVRSPKKDKPDGDNKREENGEATTKDNDEKKNKDGADEKH